VRFTCCSVRLDSYLPSSVHFSFPLYSTHKSVVSSFCFSLSEDTSRILSFQKAYSSFQAKTSLAVTISAREDVTNVQKCSLNLSLKLKVSNSHGSICDQALIFSSWKAIPCMVFHLSDILLQNCANTKEDTGIIEANNNSNSSKNNEEDGFSHRQLPLQIADPNYLNAPASFGFPFYQNQRPGNQYGPGLPLQGQTNIAGVYMPGVATVKQSATKDSSSKNDDPDTAIETKKKKRVKPKKKELVEQENENYKEKIESKTDEGTERNCPGCVGGTCDPTLSPNTNISGIPVIQIIIGLFAGVFWAAIFLFIFKNFIEQQPSKSGGYAPSPSPQYGTPQYGAPQSQYGAPATPASGYNTNRVSYDAFAQPYGRSSGGSSFGDVSRWVWDAIEKFSNLIEFVRGEELQDSLSQLDKASEESLALNDTKSNPIDNGRGLFIAPRIKRKKLRLWSGKSANLSKSEENSSIKNAPVNIDKEVKNDEKIETFFETKDEDTHQNGRLCPGCPNQQCAVTDPIISGFPIVPFAIAIAVGIKWFILFLILWVFYIKPEKKHQQSGGYDSPSPQPGWGSSTSNSDSSFLEI
ncbi:hypothetical protein Ocin01_01258, partial [Orchesella cincta]